MIFIVPQYIFKHSALNHSISHFRH